MKGGYQILDLTGATAGSPVEVKGIYKAAAGNNGKPVMILTNDGRRVYAEIAKDGDDFVTCYISAEGKTVNITIEPDDSVTTVISDPGASITGLEQAVNELNDKFSKSSFGTYIDVTYDTDYTLLTDAIVRLGLIPSGTYAELTVNGQIIMCIMHGTGMPNDRNHLDSMFLRKGSVVHFTGDSSAVAFLRVFPLV